MAMPLEAARALSRSPLDPDLREALLAFNALGAPLDAARVVHRLRELGLGIPRGQRPSTRSNPAFLTRREMQVLALLADGNSNRDIAEQLSLSHRTIEHHVASILAKLDASSRLQAIAWAREREILPM